MPHLRRWMSALGAHLTQHWVRHLLPLAVMLIMMVLFGWTLLAFYAVIFGGTMLLLAMELETAAMICFFGVAALGSFTMMLYHLAGATLTLGYMRFTLRLQQGHDTSWRELLWGFRHPLRAAGLILFVLFIVFASAGLMYLPLIFLGGWLLLTGPSLVDGDIGLFGALGRAWALSGRVYGELLVLVLGLVGVGLFVGFFPIVGPVLVPVAAVIAGVVVYDSLRRPPAA